jgi:hypothetical protein
LEIFFRTTYVFDFFVSGIRDFVDLPLSASPSPSTVSSRLHLVRWDHTKHINTAGPLLCETTARLSNIRDHFLFSFGFGIERAQFWNRLSLIGGTLEVLAAVTV